MRKLRSVAAVLALVAMAVMLPATCPCAPRPASHPAEHDCCAPPTGVRAVDPGCCGGTSVDVAPPTAVAPAAAPPVAAVLASAPVAARIALVVRAVPAAVSPPPLVLRV